VLERLIAWLGLAEISRHLREHVVFYLPLALIVAGVLAVAGTMHGHCHHAIW